MPSKNVQQKNLMMLALAYKRGHVKNVSEAVKKIAETMTEEQLEHYKVIKPDEDQEGLHGR